VTLGRRAAAPAEADAPATSRIDVFVSYSRRDRDFVE